MLSIIIQLIVDSIIIKVVIWRGLVYNLELRLVSIRECN
jgi:hypothetical protein